VAGVVAGLGRRVGIDPWPARLLLVLLAVALHGGLILLYVILWILMPLDETGPATLWTPQPPVSPTRDPDRRSIRQAHHGGVDELWPNRPRRSSSSRSQATSRPPGSDATRTSPT
jgi:phage shock protein PspC (stress-responsive transcriptional regulator)